MTNNIIRFPGKKNRRLRIDDVLIDRLTDSESHATLGRVNFTCVDCGQTSRFDFNNAIFRHVSFYCGGCGHGYRVTNPMFAQPASRGKVQRLRG